MNIQLNTATTTMRELQKKIDTIANNIANVNTSGYKRQETNFSDALVQSIEKQAGVHEVGRVTPNGIRVGSGAKISQTSIQMTQGGFQQTGRELDLAIQGEKGFFRVASEGHTYFTRDGSFQVQPILNSNQVNLVTSVGDSVLDSNGNPISFDADFDKIEVTAHGNLQVSYKDPAKDQTVVELGIAVINRTSSLEKTEANRYQLVGTEEENIENGNLQFINMAADSGEAINVKQGFLETSNVDLTEEMTELIATQRLIQSQGRAITYANDMLGLVNNIRG